MHLKNSYDKMKHSPLSDCVKYPTCCWM